MMGRRTEKMPCDEGVEIGVTQLQAREHQRLAATPEARKRQGTILPRVSEGAHPCRHLYLGLLASRTVKESIYFAWSHSVCVTFCYSITRKRI